MGNRELEQEISTLEHQRSITNFIKIFEEIKNKMEVDTSTWRIDKIVSSPLGKLQELDSKYFDHEFVDQRSGPCGDDYYGDIYLPIGDGRYIKIEYYC